MRWHVMQSASPEDAARVMGALYAKAIKGDVFACREWLDRMIGRVQDVDASNLPRIILELSPTLAQSVQVTVSTQVASVEPPSSVLDVPALVLDASGGEASAERSDAESEPERETDRPE